MLRCYKYKHDEKQKINYYVCKIIKFINCSEYIELKLKNHAENKS